MKIKPEHFSQLRAAVAIGAQRIPPQSAYIAGDSSIPRIEASKDRAKRYRWDALNASRAVAPLSDLTRAIYEYANDAHIDTALRAIIKELPSCEK